MRAVAIVFKIGRAAHHTLDNCFVRVVNVNHLSIRFVHVLLLKCPIQHRWQAIVSMSSGIVKQIGILYNALFFTI